MSTLFVPDGPFAFDDLRSFSSHGVHTTSIDEDGSIVITDGRDSYIRAYPASRRDPITFERCGDNDPSRILEVLESVLNVCLVSEYEEEYDLIRKRHRAYCAKSKANR